MSKHTPSPKKSLHYSRNKKDGVKIDGDPSDVKWAMWFDLISSSIRWVVLAVIVWCCVPHGSWMPVVWQWIKRQLPFLILFMAADSIFLLSD